MSASQCPGCRNPLPLDAPHGLCPACLLSGALKWALSSAPPTGVEWPIPPSPGDAAQDLAAAKTGSFGDYEILGEIGQSAAGVVYRARQRSRNRMVALKVLRAGRFDSPAAAARFTKETEAVARLSHPNFVPIYEVGERDGQHYLSMKLLKGGNLAHYVACQSGSDSTFTDPPPRKRSADFSPPPVTTAGRAKRTPPPPAAASPRELRATATLLASVARAIHYAHQHGLVHGNLKPSNILLDRNNHPFVADFAAGPAGIPQPGSASPVHRLTDKLGYLAPEQAEGKSQPLTSAAAIYSLGALMYEMLTS